MKRIYKVLAAFLCAAFLLPFYDVQALEVSKQYISHNRSGQYLKPQGVVIHDTDNAGATAQNNRDYFNRCQVSASAHYFVDWNQTIQTIPENEVAWHAGYTANHRYLSIEICEPRGHNPLQFNSAYQKAVELTADMCKRYGWRVDKIYSHYWCSYTFHQTDHEDPIAFFREYGKSMDTFKNDVKACMNKSTPANNVKNSTEIKKEEMYINMKKYVNGSTKEIIYADTNLTKEIGSLDPYETCDCLGIVDGRPAVMYKVNGTNKHKIGFAKWTGGVK